jgi:hypothetical protein
MLLKNHQGVELLLLFGDGTYAPAGLWPDQDGQIALHVAAYTTARGTAIPARMWTLKAIEKGEDGLDMHLDYPFP